MTERARYVLTAEYGRCIEEQERCRLAYFRALERGDQREAAALLRERADWNQLAAYVPRFVEARA